MGDEPKTDRYRQVVTDRRACVCCPTLINPSRVLGGSLDSDRIGPYSLWQGNLDAQLMVVGQDFANVQTFIDLHGRPGADVRTNQRLVRLVNTALEAAGCGTRVPLPGRACSDDKLFFTNSVLCLKSGNMSAPVPTSCVKNCNRFLRRTIDIVRPLAVIGMRGLAWKATLLAFGQDAPASFGPAVGSKPIPIGSASLFAAYHPASRRRSLPQQIDDWTTIGNALRELGKCS